MSSGQFAGALEKVSETREILLGSGVLQEAVSTFQKHFPGMHAVLVADENTFTVAGKDIYELFRAADLIRVEPVIYPGNPMVYASFENVLDLEETLKGASGVPVVVGSGTLNDLTKLASHHLGREYMVICTAASMDGYTASGASISMDGFKQTFSCPAPRVVVADLDVIMNAPKGMTASGYGDLLAKNVAGADWLVADALGIEPIDLTAWSMVQDSLSESIGSPELLSKNDDEAFLKFVKGLMMSGLSLQYYKGSRPASGAEHLMSHLWEMHETTHGVFSHGQKVGLATIASAALYERLLSRDFQLLDIKKTAESYPSQETMVQTIGKIHPNSKVVESSIEQYLKKYCGGRELVSRLELLKRTWPDLKHKLELQLIPAAKLRAMMSTVGCITYPAQMGKSLEDLKTVYRQAGMIRNRYTILDLAAETGCLEECLGELFSPGGFWVETE